MQCGWTDFMSAMMVWCGGNPLLLISPHPSASSPSFHCLPGCYMSTSRLTYNLYRHVYIPIHRCNMNKTEAFWCSRTLHTMFIRLAWDAVQHLCASIKRVCFIFHKVLFPHHSWNLCRFHLFQGGIIQLNSVKHKHLKKRNRSGQKGHEISLTCEMLRSGHGPFKKHTRTSSYIWFNPGPLCLSLFKWKSHFPRFSSLTFHFCNFLWSCNSTITYEIISVTHRCTGFFIINISHITLARFFFFFLDLVRIWDDKNTYVLAAATAFSLLPALSLFLSHTQ